MTSSQYKKNKTIKGKYTRNNVRIRQETPRKAYLWDALAAQVRRVKTRAADCS